MAQVKLYNQDGSEAGKMDLQDSLFAVEVNEGLVHEVVVAQDANGRTILSATKDRSEVRGGGKKPWKQKGTGRARHGSRRSPIWIGGGVTFGPLASRVFGKKVNKKARRKALAMVLSDKVAEGQFIAIDSIKLEDGKTSALAAVRKALPGADARAMIITTSDDTEVIRAAQNLKGTETIAAHSLNTRDLLSAPYVIASKAAIEKMTEIYA